MFIPKQGSVAGIMSFSSMTLSTMALGTECFYAEFHLCQVPIMLSVANEIFMLNVNMLSVANKTFMLNVKMLSAIMLSVANKTFMLNVILMSVIMLSVANKTFMLNVVMLGVVNDTLMLYVLC
jgi:hypothetical protein